MNDFIQRFIGLLLRLPRAKLSPNRKEIICRCPFCGDSRNINNAHFYIKVPWDNNISCYYCFKCQSAGIITPTVLMKWMLNDSPDILIELASYNKTVANLPKNRLYSNTQIYRLFNRHITQGKLSDVKLNYLNWRLGTNLDYNEILNKKIVLNIEDLLVSNRIVNRTRAPMIMDQINNYFLGFISYDNAFINMRRLVDESKVHKSLEKRYINYNIFGKYDNSMKYYILPTDIDLSKPKRIRVNIAEGPMDILSVYYNTMNDRDHNIFIAITGSSYFQAVQAVLVDLKLSFIEVHIYADNDKDDQQFMNIARLLAMHNVELYIHRNMYTNESGIVEKDFGVPKDRIKEIVYNF